MTADYVDRVRYAGSQSVRRAIARGDAVGPRILAAGNILGFLNLFSGGSLSRLSLFALPAAERLPILNDIGIRTIINGPIPVSADGEPVMGLAPELDNFFVACGFTASIAASGGAGEAMADWILDGDPGPNRTNAP